MSNIYRLSAHSGQEVHRGYLAIQIRPLWAAEAEAEVGSLLGGSETSMATFKFAGLNESGPRATTVVSYFILDTVLYFQS